MARLAEVIDLRRGRAGVFAIVALVIASAVVLIVPSAAGASVTCQVTTSPAFVPTANTPTTLAPANDRASNPPAINFGTSRRNQDVAPYTFKVDGPAPDPSKVSWDLVLVNGNKVFPADHVAVKVSNAVGDLRVSLCLVPSGVGSGSYSGTLTLAGAGLKPLPLPLTVNLKDNDLAVIWIGVVIAAFAAVFFKWWTIKIADSSAQNGASIGEFVTWLRAQWVTATIAVLGAAGGVYITKFQNRQSFDASERWGLWTATFTAVMSASLLLNALGKAVEPTKGEQAKPTH